MNLIMFAALNCAMLNTPDEKAYCRAIESNSAAWCAEIASEGLRQRCRVALGDDVSVCYSLPTEQRELCKMEGVKRSSITRPLN